eukprot:TRINITY_DN4725_c0_g1_i1.p1 TRINITY_DN4725_c0_g1~~TRINITY_DN4725_c0_g1_i1.p1  ORF type:complete len:258 (-),score=55.11 TRINITY_DN4725_c0_g1_i1:35-808(-)
MMKVVEVPVLSDNYAYLLIDTNQKVAAAVDPAGPAQVLAAAEKEGVKIVSILTTHHHADHAGGNAKLLEKVPDIPVYGGDDRITAINSKVKDQDTLKVGDLSVKVHFTPCHTSGHVLYEATTGSEPGALFTGDTLFIGGCGRFFEGTADQMNHALNEVIASLPDETRVYCGHEYTEANLKFAVSVEPNNDALNAKYKWAKSQRENSLPTVPSTVGEEKTFNPFMRVNVASIKEALGMPQGDVNSVMQELRDRKNNFK